jgi:tetratricopeptide (TPR) repeat protein
MAKHAPRKKEAPKAASLPALPGWITLLQIAIILAAGWWVYSPVLHGGWLMDDDFDIGSNPITRSSTGLWKIWFEPGSQVDYYPIKASIQWLQWHLWGRDTLGYHVTNIGLHLTSALLVWRLFAKLGLKFAWLGGLLFVLHPVMVESVAWIAELKNTLSLPPLLLAMCAVVDYEKRGRDSDYWRAAGFFLASMLCKIGAVTFPFVFLLYFWWKRDHISRDDLKASLPFFLIALVLGLTTIFTEATYHPFTQPSMQAPEDPVSRLILSGLTLTFYLFQCLWPVNLLPLYPRWSLHPPSLLQLLPWPIILTLLYGIWRQRREPWARATALGLGFFIILLAPFLGFLNGSYMRLSWVMDHLVYIPILGLLGLAVAGWERMDARLTPALRPVGLGAWAAVLALMAWGGHTYAHIFINQETLWTYTIERNPDAWLPHNNLGSALIEEGRFPEAISQFEDALRINPDLYETRGNLGAALVQTGHVPEGVEQFQEALRINPNYPGGHSNMGHVLMMQNRMPEALTEFETALRINPRDPDAHYNMGNILLALKRIAEAQAEFTAAIQIDPDHAPSHNNLGGILMNQGQVQEAVDQFTDCVRIDPQFVQARNNLGIALTQQGRVAEAMAQFQAALQLDPGSKVARESLAKLQAIQQSLPPP